MSHVRGDLGVTELEEGALQCPPGWVALVAQEGLSPNSPRLLEGAHFLEEALHFSPFLF